MQSTGYHWQAAAALARTQWSAKLGAGHCEQHSSRVSPPPVHPAPWAGWPHCAWLSAGLPCPPADQRSTASSTCSTGSADHMVPGRPCTLALVPASDKHPGCSSSQVQPGQLYRAQLQAAQAGRAQRISYPLRTEEKIPAFADQRASARLALATSCTEKALVSHLLMEKAHLASHLIAALDLQQTQQ